MMKSSLGAVGRKVQGGNSYRLSVRKFEGIRPPNLKELGHLRNIFLDAKTIIISTYKPSTDQLLYLPALDGYNATNLT